MAELKIIRMSDIVPEPTDWLWEPYIPYDAITLIQGDGGLGKTTVSLAIAAAVTGGSMLPGSSSIVPSSVIIQNGEDSYHQTIRPRLDLLGAGCDMIHVIDEEDEALSLADNRIEQTIIQTQAKLVIIDPVQAYFGKANMNSAGGVRPLLKHLGAVAARHGCAVLLVGHLNKKSGKAQYAGLGSVDIYAAARSVLTVGETNSEDDIRAIVHIKSNLAPKGVSQAFNFDPLSGFTWLGACDTTADEIMGKRPKPESRFAKARRFLESVLAGEPVPAVDIMQMAEEQDISHKTLHRAKDALGVISRKIGTQWYWILPIDVEYTEVSQDGQGSQHDSGDNVGHIGILNTAMTPGLYETDVVNVEDIQDCRNEAGQRNNMTNLTTLTNMTTLTSLPY